MYGEIFHWVASLQKVPQNYEFIIKFLFRFNFTLGRPSSFCGLYTYANALLTKHKSFSILVFLYFKYSLYSFFFLFFFIRLDFLKSSQKKLQIILIIFLKNMSIKCRNAQWLIFSWVMSHDGHDYRICVFLHITTIMKKVFLIYYFAIDFLIIKYLKLATSSYYLISRWSLR